MKDRMAGIFLLGHGIRTATGSSPGEFRLFRGHWAFRLDILGL